MLPFRKIPNCLLNEPDSCKCVCTYQRLLLSQPLHFAHLCSRWDPLLLLPGGLKTDLFIFHEDMEMEVWYMLVWLICKQNKLSTGRFGKRSSVMNRSREEATCGICILCSFTPWVFHREGTWDISIYSPNGCYAYSPCNYGFRSIIIF